MKALRLILFKICPKSCEGCCNKDWDLDNLPVVQSFSGYDEVLLTGGEPMLDPDLVRKVIHQIRQENVTCKIYMYTALPQHPNTIGVLRELDGITITIREQRNVKDFYSFMYRVSDVLLVEKSIRVNIFKGIVVSDSMLSRVNVKSDLEWIKNCPLPVNEVLMRLKWKR